MAVIGFLHAGSPHPPVAAFHRTLAEAGYLEQEAPAVAAIEGPDNEQDFLTTNLDTLGAPEVGECAR
jgi:hypothetical protein